MEPGPVLFRGRGPGHHSTTNVGWLAGWGWGWQLALHCTAAPLHCSPGATLNLATRKVQVQQPGMMPLGSTRPAGLHGAWGALLAHGMCLYHATPSDKAAATDRGLCCPPLC